MASVFAPGLPSNQPPFSFRQAPQMTAAQQPQQHAFNPYENNGGSTLGISGADFAILAGDTRSTRGFSINSRYVPKIFRVGTSTSDPSIPDPISSSSHIALAVVGFAADGNALRERLDTAYKLYYHQHGKPMSLAACAQRLSHILYGRRFFPLFVYCLLAGLDEEGKGCLYSYDPVGSYERVQCQACGSASSLMVPFLDNQVDKKNQYVPGSGTGHDLKEQGALPLPRKDVEELVRDAFSGACERQIEVGDGLQMLVVTKDGIEEVYHELKKD